MVNSSAKVGKGSLHKGPVVYVSEAHDYYSMVATGSLMTLLVAPVKWMSRDQRAVDNWALARAMEHAVANRAPLMVAFCLVSGLRGDFEIFRVTRPMCPLHSQCVPSVNKFPRRSDRTLGGCLSKWLCSSFQCVLTARLIHFTSGAKVPLRNRKAVRIHAQGPPGDIQGPLQAQHTMSVSPLDDGDGISPTLSRLLEPTTVFLLRGYAR